MSMTHYMQLLAENQPWNLLIFMAVPIILAETVVVTELYILYTRNFFGIVRWVNKWAGILVGFYFAIVFAYLLVTAAVPLTTGGGWRGWIDVSAVGFYLSGVIPLLGIALLEVGVIARDRSPEQKLMIHASLVALFLVLGHVAMVFGMLDPALAGGTVAMPMHGH
ncbi:MAG: permease [Defluviicoccus sp.]|nr:permease [Defluviicoccus sp.]MDG4607522.1 permease [Defluviicoccus sp.]